jgi:hypothetical protein
MFIDGRLDEETIAEAAARFQYIHHPDSHGLFWDVPDEMVRSTISHEHIFNLEMTQRVSTVGVFGRPSEPRTLFVQGKLLHMNFGDGNGRIYGQPYPRETVKSMIEDIKNST